MKTKPNKITYIAFGFSLLLVIAVVGGLINASFENTVNVHEEITYYSNVEYPNVKSCNETPGGGIWTEPILNTLGLYYDSPLDHGEIGVLEITEPKLVYRVEVYGSGCEPPVNLTCSGITVEVQSFHDAPPLGNETITFDISWSEVITLYTTQHDDDVNKGFGIKWIKLYYVTAITSELNVDPDTLNLRSRGSWITCYIELSEDYELEDINLSTILLNDTILAETRPTAIGDHDEDGVPDLMLKFDRAEVESFIWDAISTTQLPEDRHLSVTLTISGELTTPEGSMLQGNDTIRVLCQKMDA
ncbi:MAG: hypothetical protein OEY22_06015 [Candidatus Bathyarchaeota archaeon]|nr:hypothetical protein [Candidatus Bathyarchaeota archaeon]MDH5788806.1 hypothetical protein [Candidatus Bathyarchaeota archaeon]